MDHTSAPDVSRLSLACAEGHHERCKGYRINPDPDCDPEQVTLPCECPQQVKHGRKHTASTASGPGKPRGDANAPS